MNRQLPEGFALLLVSLILAACGNQPPPPTGATPSAVAPPAAATAAAPTGTAVGTRRPTAVPGVPNTASIALLLASTDDRAKLMRDIFVQAATSPTTTVTVSSAEGDAAKQQAQVAETLKSGAGVLVVQPVDQDAAADYVDAAHKAGARVIALDRLVNTRDLDAYVSFDNFGAGQAQANEAIRWLGANKVKTPWNFVLLEGPAGDSVAAEITRGYYDVLKPFVDKKQVVITADLAHPAGSSEQGNKTTTDALTKTSNNLAAILANNSALARGALQALDAQKLVGKVFVGGAGADMENIRELCTGRQNLAVVQNLQPMAETAARLAVALVHGRSVAETGLAGATLAVADRQVPMARIPAQPLTLDSAQAVLVQSGLYTSTDIGKCTTALAEGASVPRVSASGKLQLWTQEDPNLFAYISNLAGQFMEANPGAEIRITNLDADGLRSRLQPDSSAGLADLFWTPGDTALDLAGRHLLQPADNLVDTSVFVTSTYAAAVYQGKGYGLPINIANYLLLYYNKKLVKDAPFDTAALTRLAPTLTKADGSQWTLLYNQAEPSYVIPWLTGFKGKLQADNAVTLTLNTPAMLDTLAFVKSLRDQKVISPDSDGAVTDALFRQGKAALVINGDWAYKDYASALGDSLVVARLPRVTKTAEYPHTFISGRYLLFAQNLSGERLDIAKAFASFITSRAVQLDMAKKWDRLPALRDALNDPVIAGDAFLKPAADQALVGFAQPAEPARRCMLDALNAGLGPFYSGKANAADTAKAMQAAADACMSRQ